MTIYIGAQLTVNGVFNEKIEVRFNDYDGAIGLVFVGEGENGGDLSTSVSYAAAQSLCKALGVALSMRKKENS